MKEFVPLSGEEREVILGSLLGDGSLKIHKGYRNARFSFRHSVVQEAYFLWKVNKLQSLTSSKSVFYQENDGGYGKNQKVRFQSCALPSLTDMYLLTHKGGKFRIRRKWLDQMTALSLAIWWCDDGSLISNGRRGVFCTDGFERDQVEILARYLKIMWNIRTVVAPVKGKRGGKQNLYYRIWIRSAEELQKFLRIILPHIEVEEMLSKAILLYHDSQLQQRWISEVVDKTRFSQETVERWVRLKKEKWKAYQKMI